MGRMSGVAGGLAPRVWPGELPGDAAATCEALVAEEAAVRVAESRRVVLIGHWLDLHAPLDSRGIPTDGPVLPGTQRYVAAGADGTPLVAEFACAELGALLGMHLLAAKGLVGRVANLRHRHPVLYTRVLAGEVPVWKATETARLVARTELALTVDQAHWIDDRSHEWITTLPWNAYLELLEQLIIDVDPVAAQHRADAAAARQGVWTTRSNEHGLTTLVARASGGKIGYLLAVVDLLATALAERGDTRTLDARRAAALVLLAHPAHALAILAEHAATHAHDTDHPGDDGGDDEDGDGVHDLERSDAAEPGPDALALFGDPGAGPDHDDDDPESGMPVGGVPRRGQWSFLTLPDHLAGALRLLAKPGVLDRLLPAASVYLHLDHRAIPTNTGPATVEGHGVLTADQARHWLGHRRVTITPVVDLNAEHAPVDGYVFPTRLRQVMHLTNPRDAFPYGTAGAPGGAGKDADHTIPYVPPDQGGPPGQTGLHNGTLLSRFAHRLKTHGRWRLLHLKPGHVLWHSPHGYSYLVDPLGTHPVPHAVLPWLLHTAQATGALDDDLAPTRASTTTPPEQRVASRSQQAC